jgi:hypothetical protein
METKRKRAESREGMRVTTIALTEEMHRKLAVLAIDRRTVLTELVREALAQWLSRQGRNPSGKGNRR